MLYTSCLSSVHVCTLRVAALSLSLSAYMHTYKCSKGYICHLVLHSLLVDSGAQAVSIQHMALYKIIEIELEAACMPSLLKD